MPDHEQLLTLASEIVSAHVSNNAVSMDQLAALIQQVFNTLATVEQRTAEPPRPDPAVPIKQSVRADHLACLECGKHFSMIKRHLMNEHHLTPEQLPAALGAAVFVPDCRTELRHGSVGNSEEDRVGSEAWGCGEETWPKVMIAMVRSGF